ncbi:MAG: CorA family divalent cation transporter [Coxiellaceae bacterium]|nr:CorA family divalent cation transporter [Coxiellaceae bacterium]
MNNKQACKAEHNKIKCLEFDGKGGAREVGVDVFDSSDKLVWLQLTATSAKRYFKQKTDIPPIISEILTAKATRPRTIAIDDSLIAIFRGINFNRGCSPENMISVRMWLHGNRIITIQRHKSVTIKELEHALAVNVGPCNTTEFLIAFLDIISDKSAEAIAKLGLQLDALENQLEEKLSPTLQYSLNEMQRQIIMLRRYLIPQREAITRIPVNKISWLDNVNSMELREIADTNLRLVEDLDAERDRSRVIYEGIVSKTQAGINQKMYLLSIVAVVFMPLGFLAGVFGMNLGGLPGLNYKHGFMIVSLIMLALFGLQLVYLKIKKWI